MKKITILLLGILIISGCMPSDSIDDCVSVYYKELNCGTFTVLIRPGPWGIIETKLRGVWIRNANGTVLCVGAGKVKVLSGLTWKTIKEATPQELAIIAESEAPNDSP